MRTVSVSEAKARLSELIDDAETTHEHVTITKHGRPAAVIVAADDLGALHDTIHWLSQPGIRESVAEADADISAGDAISSDELRDELGLHPR